MALSNSNVILNNAILRLGRPTYSTQKARGFNVDYPMLGIDCLTCHPDEVINRYTLPSACKRCPIGHSIHTKKH